MCVRVNCSYNASCRISPGIWGHRAKIHQSRMEPKANISNDKYIWNNVCFWLLRAHKGVILVPNNLQNINSKIMLEPGHKLFVTTYHSFKLSLYMTINRRSTHIVPCLARSVYVQLMTSLSVADDVTNALRGAIYVTRARERRYPSR